MINLVLISTASFVTAFSGALMPGPLLFYTIAKSFKHGAYTGFFVIIGHALLEIIIVLLLLTGIKSLLNKILFEIILSFIGGASLILMGVLMIIPAAKNKINIDMSVQKINKKNNYGLLLGGFIISISNPYFLIWWFFIGAGYLFASIKLGIFGIIFFFIGHILADFAWYIFISFCTAKSKKIINDTFYKILVLVCGVLIIFMGSYFLYNGFSKV